MAGLNPLVQAYLDKTTQSQNEVTFPGGRTPNRNTTPLGQRFGGGGGIGTAAGGNFKAPPGWEGKAGWENLQPTVKEWVLKTLAQFPGATFASGWRDPAHNAAINGAPNSGHMRGWKADFGGGTQIENAVAEWLRSQGVRVLQHDAGTGYHVDASWENWRP